MTDRTHTQPDADERTVTRARRGWPLAGLLIVTASVLAACGADSPGTLGAGGGNSPAAGNGAVGSAPQTGGKVAWADDRCSIVGKDVVGAALKATVTKAAPEEVGACRYTTDSDSEVILTFVDLGAFHFKAEINRTHVKPEDHLPGLGVDAFSNNDGLSVLLADGRAFIVNADALDRTKAPSRSDVQHVLAREILDRHAGG